MKIVILDAHTLNPGDISWAPLEAVGELVIYDRTSSPAQAVERVGDAEMVLVNKTPMRADVIEACPNLKYIGIFATGYNTIDLEAAKKKGVAVTNVPNYGTFSVAQSAIALLLEITNQVAHHSAEVYDGRWQQSVDWSYHSRPLVELYGKTMGIIGFGNIGARTGEIASAIGMKVVAFNREKTGKAANFADYVGLEELLAVSDVISLHCPYTPETKEIINKESIAKMKDDVIIINTSRGPLINELALANALNSGKVNAAGLDVVSKEPILQENPLLKAKNCFITPHISWASRASRSRVMSISAENVVAFLHGEKKNIVN